eukprot:NODE_16513_length_990_cov_6.586327.p1 GENE.NODE_16513_length_990_cov_6.586327~~NODE_16513_length_990_cov_6.586327.p1  ORF type:complete len:144 (-),score=31.11 NODE_16513_length_990_cov_6.586327:41-472(-)
MASVNSRLGDSAMALKHCGEALAIATTVYGSEDHEDVADIYIIMSHAHSGSQEGDRASEYVKRSEEIMRRIRGDRGCIAQPGDAHNYLGVAHSAAGNPTAAKRHVGDARQVVTAAAGTDARETPDAGTREDGCAHRQAKEGGA